MLSMTARIADLSFAAGSFRAVVAMIFLLCCGLFEKHFEIAPQVIKAGGGYFRTFLGLSENESALDNGLGVERQAARRPITLNAVLLHSLPDVGLKRSGVPTDALLAGFADRG